MSQYTARVLISRIVVVKVEAGTQEQARALAVQHVSGDRQLTRGDQVVVMEVFKESK